MSTAEPRRPLGPRDYADAWTSGPAGRFWGRSGAAGLLAHDPQRGVLMQHRVSWSDHGGTWGLPGGARHTGEDAIAAAVREAGEEAGVPGDAVVVTGTHRFDVGYWSYTTVLTDVVAPFQPVIGDPESEALAWVSLPLVQDLPLHPGLVRMWPTLRARLERPAVLVVDVANVMGSRPDGWWKDRASAAQRLIGQIAALASASVPGALFGLDDAWHLWPQIVAVVEGQARGSTQPPPPHAYAPGSLRLLRATRDGDQSIVDVVADLSPCLDVTVVTSDRVLRSRVAALGARTVGAGTLLRMLPP